MLGVALSCLSERLSPRSGTGNPAWSVWFELSHSLYILLLKGGVVSDRSADCEKIYAGGLTNYTAQHGLCRLRMGWGRTPRSSNPGTVRSASRAAQSNEQLVNEKASASCCGSSPRKFDSLREQKILPLARVARVGFDSGPAL